MFDSKLVLVPLARKYMRYSATELLYAEYFIFGLRIAKLGVYFDR